VHPLADGSRRDERLVRTRQEILITMVGLKPEHLARYPHEFSGGQRQRIGIARALALDPALVIADEPVSALDVSVQAQVINLMMDLQERLGLTYIFIAHDLAVVRQIATRTAVMYLGEVVEIGPTEDVFRAPAPPDTAALLAAVPKINTAPARAVVTGEVPSPLDPPPGCRFHPRCPRAQSRCRDDPPKLSPLLAPRQVACHFPL
jgi:peptide/nickel transport system ATP-binding protein